MSGNLSKMEKLQHRHLTLLRALQEEGINVKCDRDGKWDIHCPVVERMPLSGLNATGMIVDELATMPLRPDAVQESCRAVLNQALWEETAAPAVPVAMPPGYKFNAAWGSYSLNQFLASGWTFDQMKQYKVIEPMEVQVVTAEGCVLDLQLTVVGQHVSGQIDGKPFTRGYDDLMRHLLNLLRCVILAAPAKA